MKAVLMSIQPRWCELIASGKKTVEVRKTRPKIKVPFKVYIYCTKNKEKLIEVIHDGDDMGDFIHRGKPNFIKTFAEDWSIYGIFKGGKVIGEFVCDEIEKIFQFNSGWVQEHACISREEYFKYLGLPYNSHFDSKGAYAWHITDLVIYDEPKALEKFFKPCGDCDKRGTIRCTEEATPCRAKKITRPPQSWCYVERSESNG